MREDQLKSLWKGHTPRLLDRRFESAVLCPLVKTTQGLSLLYEVRAASLRRQPGEVCFPGGRVEPGETAVECALRETREELNIPPSAVEILGQSDFICHPSGILLQPVVGFVRPEGMAALHPGHSEVAEVFLVPIAFFLGNPPEVYAYEMRPSIPEDFPYEAVGVGPDYAWAHSSVNVNVWHWEGHPIWGMTARITKDLIETMRDTGSF